MTCYISVATIKRAELGKPVSTHTLNKLVKFFGVEPSELLVVDVTEKNNKALSFKPLLQPVTIDWDLLRTLPDTTEHEHINYICSELYASLMKLNGDEVIRKVFSLKLK